MDTANYTITSFPTEPSGAFLEIATQLIGQYRSNNSQLGSVMLLKSRTCGIKMIYDYVENHLHWPNPPYSPVTLHNTKRVSATENLSESTLKKFRRIWKDHCNLTSNYSSLTA